MPQASRMRKKCDFLSVRRRVKIDPGSAIPVSCEPDDTGHFGPYGGTYASETLMHALEELKEAYFRWRGDEEFMARLDAALAHLLRQAVDGGGRRGAHPAQARGPKSHRRPQDQQHGRPGAVG